MTDYDHRTTNERITVVRRLGVEVVEHSESMWDLDVLGEMLMYFPMEEEWVYQEERHKGKFADLHFFLHNIMVEANKDT